MLFIASILLLTINIRETNGPNHETVITVYDEENASRKANEKAKELTCKKGYRYYSSQESKVKVISTEKESSHTGNYYEEQIVEKNFSQENVQGNTSEARVRDGIQLTIQMFCQCPHNKDCTDTNCSCM